MAKKKKKKRKGRHLRRGSLKGGASKPFRGKKGSGARFQKCMARMAHRKGVRNPRKLCAAIMWAKYPRGVRHR